MYLAQLSVSFIVSFALSSFFPSSSLLPPSYLLPPPSLSPLLSPSRLLPLSLIPLPPFLLLLSSLSLPSSPLSLPPLPLPSPSLQYQLTHKCYHEAGEVLNLCSTLLEGYQGEKVTLLRTFYLIIQVTHLLSAGQVCSVERVCV